MKIKISRVKPQGATNLATHKLAYYLAANISIISLKYSKVLS